MISSNDLYERSRIIDKPGAIEYTYCGVNLSKMDEYRAQNFHEVETRNLDFHQLSDDVGMLKLVFENNVCDCFLILQINVILRLVPILNN